MRAADTEPTPSVVSQASWEQREKENLIAALEQSNWKIYGPGGAAELGMKPTTLTSRLQALGIRRPRS